jgi:fructokinase
MIQVMGEALIDIIVNTEGEVDSVVGGGPLNTARTIARLGHEVEFIGGISQDAFGRRIQRLLEADGVKQAIVPLLPESSTLAIASLDESGAATYRFMMDNTAASSVSVEMALDALNVNARAIHIGTLALVLTPLTDAVCAVTNALGSDQILMVDPNARPSVMADSRIFDETVGHVINRANIIKVSGDDLAFMSPSVDSNRAAQELHDQTGAIVLFTDGAQALNVYVGGAKEIVAVPPVEVVDTVGAGDSFSGGFLAFWAQNNYVQSDLASMEKVLAATEFGIKVAGVTCQRAGAQPPFAHEL